MLGQAALSWTTAWILAGGLSSRFGSDKAVFPVDGVPMVLRIATTLREAGLSPALVARVPRGLPIPELLEADGPRHPLHGVACALAATESWALVCPCDLDALTLEQVRALLAAAEGPGAAVAVGQPLLAVLPGSLGPRAARIAAAGGSVYSFVEGLPTVDLGPIHNLNRR